MSRPLLLCFAFVAATFAACGQRTKCLADRDCAGGRCRADGTCAPATTGARDAGAADAGEVGSGAGADAGTTADAGSDGGPTWTFDGGGPTCANFDGVVDRDEVPLDAGLSATFLASYSSDPSPSSSYATVDTAGAGASPDVQWDFTAAQPSDGRLNWTSVSPSGQWWSSDYPDATYAARFTLESDVWGVFQSTSNALLLLGVVSTAANATNFQYSPPVKVLSFPLREGSTWSVQSSVSGTVNGFLYDATEGYQFDADARGSVKVPLGTFPAIRLRSEMTRTVGMAVYTRRSFYFVAECAGIVAQVTSAYGETSPDFTQAQELWRLGP